MTSLTRQQPLATMGFASSAALMRSLRQIRRIDRLAGAISPACLWLE
jgi:hypothetical protein